MPEEKYGSNKVFLEKSCEAGDSADWEKMVQEKDIMILDPSWLSQYGPCEQENAFYRSVLPILAMRMDPDCRPESLPGWEGQTSLLGVKFDDWTLSFTSFNFSMEKTMQTYKKAPVEFITMLTRFIIMERAKAMYEKLWTQCSEFYLLGLVFHRLSSYSHGMLKESSSALQCLPRLQEIIAKRAETSQASHLTGQFQTDQYESVIEDLDLKSLDVGMTKMQVDDGKFPLMKYKLDIDDSVSDSEFEFCETCREQMMSDVDDCKDVHTSEEPPVTGLISEVRSMLKTFLYMKKKWIASHQQPYFQNRNLDRWEQVLNLGFSSTPKESWKGIGVMNRVWEAYQEGPLGSNCAHFEGSQQSQWLVLSANVRSFALYAGSVDPVGDPLKSVAGLRNHVSRMMTYTADLHQRIAESTKLIENQQRIIACLSYRHLIESLPPKTGGKKHLSGPAWTAFWERAWNNAEHDIYHKNLQTNNPLVALIDSRPGYREQIKKCGAALFSTLSANIHDYCDKNTVVAETQWDINPREILKALTPANGFGKETDWNKEREKYC